jgi:hypothetical protein
MTTPTRRELAAEVYARGLRYALAWRRHHEHAQSIPDVFGDLFASWLSKPEANGSRVSWDPKWGRAPRSVAVVTAKWIAWQTCSAIDGNNARSAAVCRRARSIATIKRAAPPDPVLVLSTWY